MRLPFFVLYLFSAARSDAVWHSVSTKRAQPVDSWLVAAAAAQERAQRELREPARERESLPERESQQGRSAAKNSTSHAVSTKNGSLKVCYVFCKAKAREPEQELTLSVCVCLALGYVRVVVVVPLDLAFCRKCHWQNERTGRTGNPGSYTLFSINACYLAPATHTASCMCV